MRHKCSEGREGIMARLIKRYGSRKLYDTQESKYIALSDLATIIREGEEVQVIDNASSEDVTSITLTQVISDAGRKSGGFLSKDLLHDLIRAGESAVSNGVRQLQEGVDRFVQRSLDRVGPIRQARQEMDVLKQRIAELESALTNLEEDSSHQ